MAADFSPSRPADAQPTDKGPTRERNGCPSESDESAFERLKGLLLGDQPKRVADLEQRLADPARRAQDLAQVLPEAVRASGAADQRLADALARPVDACIQRSVSQDPQRLADALFPVMGPAIRRAIGESLKGLVQSINQAVEHSLSPRGFRWRLEAWRSGSTFAEVVLKHTLVYRVEAAYLIHNETGLLIDHVVAATDTTLKDEDAVSAMLTAIQDFVQDSFSAEGAPLESVEIGQRLLWLLRGPAATLACVIIGLPPHSLRTDLAAVLLEVHATLAAPLAGFRGDKSALMAAHPLLEQCLALEYREDAVPERQTTWWPWGLALLLLLLLAGTGWMAWQHWDWQQRLSRARAELADTPGLALLHWAPARRIDVELLADPLSSAVSGPARQRVSDETIRSRLRIRTRPYVSADPPIVLERARRQLRPPPGVTLDLDGGLLRVSGRAPSDWVERLRRSPLPPAGAEGLDLSALEPELKDQSDLAERVRAALQPPEGVRVTLDGTNVQLRGAAPQAWIMRVAERLMPLRELTGCTDRGLVATEALRARQLVAELQGLRLYFSEGIEPTPDFAARLQRAAGWMRELADLRDALPGLWTRIVVVGRSDGLGDPRRNLWLRGERASFAVARWRELGVPGTLLSAEAAPDSESSGMASRKDRRVEIRVELTLPAPRGCNPPS